MNWANIANRPAVSAALFWGVSWSQPLRQRSLAGILQTVLVNPVQSRVTHRCGLQCRQLHGQSIPPEQHPDFASGRAVSGWVRTTRLFVVTSLPESAVAMVIVVSRSSGNTTSSTSNLCDILYRNTCEQSRLRLHVAGLPVFLSDLLSADDYGWSSSR